MLRLRKLPAHATGSLADQVVYLVRCRAEHAGFVIIAARDPVHCLGNRLGNPGGRVLTLSVPRLCGIAALASNRTASEILVLGQCHQRIKCRWCQRLHAQPGVSNRVEGIREHANHARQTLGCSFKSTQRPLSQVTADTWNDVVPEWHGNSHVLPVASGNHEASFPHKFWRFFVIQAGRRQCQCLQDAQHQPAINNGLARLGQAQGLDVSTIHGEQQLPNARRALYGGIEERIHGAHLLRNLTFTVEVDGDVFGKPCRLLPAHALIDGSAVYSQTGGVFHGIVVILQPVEHGAEAALYRPCRDLQCAVGRQ